MLIPSGHVRQDDLIANVKSAQNLNGTDGTTTQLDGNTRGGPAVLGEFEQADGAIRIGLHWFAHVQDIIEPFQFDRSFHTQIRPRAAWQNSFHGDVDSYGAGLNGGIDAHNATGDQAVAGIDDGALLQLDILGLGFVDANLRLEPSGIGDARDVGTGGQLLADMEAGAIAEFLQHAINASPDLE